MGRPKEVGGGGAPGLAGAAASPWRRPANARGAARGDSAGSPAGLPGGLSPGSRPAPQPDASLWAPRRKDKQARQAPTQPLSRTWPPARARATGPLGEQEGHAPPTEARPAELRDSGGFRRACVVRAALEGSRGWSHAGRGRGEGDPGCGATVQGKSAHPDGEKRAAFGHHHQSFF